MEVDMHSPPPTFRPVTFTVKRPRSPGSPSQERQTKRPSLVPIGLDGQGGRAPTAPDGAVGSQTANLDDWVRQARELSITSPLSLTVGFPSVLEPSPSNAQNRADEHMAVDYEEPQTLRLHIHPSSSRPWSTKGHLPSIHIMTTPALTPAAVQNALYAPSPAPFSVLTEPPSSSTEPPSSTASVPDSRTNMRTPCPPDIFLFPATPSDMPSHQHQLTSSCGPQGEGEPELHVRTRDESLSQSSLTRGQDRIDGSPRPSRAPDIPTSLHKKHRVTMGPRADCVKCRTGVRGHWMHFD